jgi:hypothetical protein
VAVAALVLHAPAQSRQQDYRQKRTEALAAAGQRHLQLGAWARDQGLVPQATTQFRRAVEVSEGNNPGAVTVLGIMRGYGDDFWSQRRKKPSRTLLVDFQKRAARAEEQLQKDHLDLGALALAAKLDDAAKLHYRTALSLGAELERDGKGGYRIAKKRIADELGEWLAGEVHEAADGRPVFEPAGSTAPRLAGLVVHEDDALQVRTDLSVAVAAELHALGTALLPHVRERLDGTPTRRLVLTVFSRRQDFVDYLTARGLGDWSAGGGLADYATFQTLVSAEGHDGQPWPKESLHALVLHELAHLCFFAVAPAAMPDWYAEGFAESFGGAGTFAWDGKALAVGLPLQGPRLAALRAAPFPVRQLVDARIAPLLAREPERALVFYTQCQALLAFLREADCPWREKFALFEAKCRGQNLGAAEGTAAGNHVPATAEFVRLFAADYDTIDAAFVAWLAKRPG